MIGPLEVRSLTKRFGDTVALDGVDLTVEPGQLVGFLGPNGSGKTTTMRAILQLVAIDGGTISWGGAPIDEEQRRRIGYLPQERGLYARMQVHEQIAYFGRLAGLASSDAASEADRWIDAVGLTGRRHDLVQTLSVGNQQRVQLAVALVHRPRLLVLDEPFAGLDPVAVAGLQAIIVDQLAAGVGVVFSSHQLDLVQDLCDDVTIISAGITVATGTVSGLRAASNERQVEIRWEDPAFDWVPSIEGLRLEPSPAGHTRFSVPRGTDPGALIATAAAQSAIAAVRFEPPPLDQVFMELVS